MGKRQSTGEPLAEYVCMILPEMVVKRISIDAAAVNNIFHGDLIQRSLIQQLSKSSYDGIFGAVHHSLPFNDQRVDG